VSEPLVIVGNGMAAARLVDELTRCALGRHAIAVIGDEPRLAYNRVLLSSVLAGETALKAIELKPMSRWLLPVLVIAISGRAVAISAETSIHVVQIRDWRRAISYLS
jgi:nitrite reductase (NADH) large subunit